MSNPFKKETKKDDSELIELDEQIEQNEQNEEAVSEPAINEESSAVDSETATLNDETEKLKSEYETLNNQYIRLAADFDNYRKRQAQERESLLKYGAESTMKKLLEVLDNFERGQKAVESVEDCETVKESYNLVFKQMFEILQKMGLEFIDAVGSEFDPSIHEAVMQTPTSEHAENTVIAELQKGYKLGDRVLRPALVNVAVPE